jgi:glutamate synthase domain-containing protein 2
MGIWILAGVMTVLVGVVVYDLLQRKHAILRNFPIIGHFRYIFEAVGPELRQYIVTGNDEERPFSRDQRTWIYTSAKKQNNYFGFGTDNDLEQSPGYLIVRHSAFPRLTPHVGDADYDPQHAIACLKVLGGARGRAKAFTPASVVNVSAMSFGSLSAPAIEALNRGCQLAGCLHNTGEGGVSPYHLRGGELIWQVGTGYFGCRGPEGAFSMAKLRQTVEGCPQIRAIEIKLSQGAKPGAGGILPKAKITPEIARIRGVSGDRDVISPAAHSAFSDPDSLLDFVEGIAAETGLPVGIKSAVGDLAFWRDLARLMESGHRGVDFLTIDGGEGGTGAAPLVFSDHLSMPFKQGFNEVHRIFVDRGISENVVFIGSGKLGLPSSALTAFALGCDLIAVAREAMLAIGCIQAQKCQTNHCPTGVATQKAWLVRGLVPSDKAARLANYMIALRKDLLAVAHACGEVHPANIGAERLEFLDGQLGSRTLKEVFPIL